MDRSEISLSLSKIDDSLKSKDFQSAYDMLMVALRIAPSEPKILASIESFVTAATDTDSDEAESLAEDLVGRSDALVAFQSPSTVADARKRVNALQEKFASRDSTDLPVAPNPIDEVRPLVRLASDSNADVTVRTRMSQQARSTLEALEVECLIANTSGTNQSKLDEIKKIRLELDAAEADCIAKLYAECESQIAIWKTQASALPDKTKDVKVDGYDTLNREIDELIASGIDLMQEVAPYAKTKTSNSVNEQNSLSTKVEELQRMKNWLYNRRVLEQIKGMEGDNQKPAMEKLEALAAIKEEMLSSYIQRRHGELWEKLFESLSENDKINATKMRLMKVRGE